MSVLNTEIKCLTFHTWQGAVMANKCISQNVPLEIPTVHQIENNITLTWIMYFPSKPLTEALSQFFMDLNWVLINTLTDSVPPHDICGNEIQTHWLTKQQHGTSQLSTFDNHGPEGRCWSSSQKNHTFYLVQCPLGFTFWSCQRTRLKWQRYYPN